jgi:hypothetical protein
MPVLCLFTLGRHGNFTAGVTMGQPDLLCTALAHKTQNNYHQINVRENRKGNQEWIIQRLWQHWAQ